MELTVLAMRGVSGHGPHPATWAAQWASGTAPTGLDSPKMPPALAPHWRRASVLARWVLALVAPLVADLAPGERATMPVIWATGLGELTTTEAVLEAGLSRGRVRPAAFRGSVHNTPASLLSVAFGLTGSIETLGMGAGAATVTLLRTGVLLRRHPHVLVVAGDVPSPGARAWLAAQGLPSPSPQVVALRVGRTGAGAQLRLGGVAGPRMLDVPAPWTRGGGFGAVPPAVSVLPTGGLTAVAALAAGTGGTVREWGPAGRTYTTAVRVPASMSSEGAPEPDPTQ